VFPDAGWVAWGLRRAAERRPREATEVGQTQRMIGVDSIGLVLEVLRPERRALLDLLGELDTDQWGAPTECPEFTVKGIATHLLGDDLSLLSRQRDGAISGLVEIASDHPGADIRALLAVFNERWVTAAGFLSVDLLMNLLTLSGEWTANYYDGVDPAAPGEHVGFFGGTEASSPYWQSIAREYYERWIHHSQIRRALGRPSVAQRPLLDVGVAIAATVTGLDATIPADPDSHWFIGALDLGPDQQAADILTWAYMADEIRGLVDGPPEPIEVLSSFGGRPAASP
jgi:uncharacterized protein (TIGR03083 family)